ncbi:unnamed protein product [Sphagnum jensenii]|uniref:Uncharacterized protein n=1 Tax=Sphagnum jensenii TaxID=128206 RepID=A0ABP0WBE1_9BRYO
MRAIRAWAGGMMMYKKNDMREKEREREGLSSPTQSINQASKLACKFSVRLRKNLELHISYFEILEMGSLLPGSWW